MRASFGQALLLLAAMTLPYDAARGADDGAFSLRFVESRKIHDGGSGFTEPSGLGLARSGSAMWSVSDDTEMVFSLDLNGNVRPGASFPLDSTDLEGIAVDGPGRYILAVQESGNRIHVIDVETRRLIGTRAISEMAGYDEIGALIAAPSGNKGLEGITIDAERGTVFLIIEGEPRLLLIVAPDLSEISEYRDLSAAAGFADPDTPDKKLDVSGLSHDPGGNDLWIVSDQAGRVFRYDLENGRATSAALLYRKDGEVKRIKKAEGVAYDAEARRLYVVNDRAKKSRLFVFEVE
jgi:uncharacterized protein YjiK